MPERARAVVYVLDSEGRPIPTATITLRQSGTTTNITETIYANDDPDTSQLTNGAFFSGADGKVVFYLTDPKRLDMLVTKSGYTSQTIPIDVQKSSLIGNHALIDTAVHTASGLTTGHVIKATGATTYAFGVNPLEDKITTAGDLLYGTAADTAARLGIGTAGQVLKVNSGATAPEWGAAASAALGDLLDCQFARKTVEETVTSSTVLQDDNELLIPVGTNQTWRFECLILAYGAEAGDIKVAFTGPAGATIKWGGHGPASALTGGTTADTEFRYRDTSDFAIYGTEPSIGISIFISGIILTGGTAGNLQLQWAQGTSSGTATAVTTQSHLMGQRFA